MSSSTPDMSAKPGELSDGPHAESAENLFGGFWPPVTVVSTVGFDAHQWFIDQHYQHRPARRGLPKRFGDGERGEHQAGQEAGWVAAIELATRRAPAQRMTTPATTPLRKPFRRGFSTVTISWIPTVSACPEDYTGGFPPSSIRKPASAGQGRGVTPTASSGTCNRDRTKEMLIMAMPSVVDHPTWRKALDELRVREKAATRELDAIAAERRRLPMVRMPEYTLVGAEGPVRLVDIFDGRSQLIVYNHMWDPDAEWQCGGCTSLTSSFTRLDFLDNYDARFVIVTQGPIEAALAYAERVGNTMTWYSTADSPFGADVDAPPGGGFAVNVFLRDGETVYRTWHTTGRGVEQLTFTFPLVDVLPYGRQEEWQDSPEGWPQGPTMNAWLDSPDVARLYGRAT
ncbi:DUF899 domain-containing protein [Plantactinospora solaniradicis]|uniref:DUF899 domain-containing protein n=1 Tax=Plantactinospora solaniradicis TaxID=1723736 RepID=A0ABW1K8U0_9ACTN